MRSKHIKMPGAADLSSLTDPVIIMTSVSGTNPPTFTVTAADLQVGWYYQLDYTTNGSAPDGSPDATQVFTSGEALGDTLSWGTGPFTGGVVVKWRVRYGSTNTGPWSNWSNTLSDTMAFAPSALFGGSDIGYVWDPTDLTHVWQSNAGTTAGAFASVVGRLDDLSGKGNNINSYANDTSRPTLVNENNGLVSFDGVNDKIKSIGGFKAKGATTICMVVKGTDSGAHVFWAENSTASTAPAYAPGTRLNSATQILNFIKNDATTQIAHVMAVALMDGNPHVLFIVDDGSTVSVSKDGAAFVTDAWTLSGTFTMNESSFGTCDNANANTGGFAVFKLGAGTIIGRNLTGTLGTAGSERTQLYNWVAAKHGLTTL